MDSPETAATERRSLSDWLPLAITLFGMFAYTSITKMLAVAPGQLDFAADLRPAQTVTGQAAALMQFRGVAALALTIALASAIVSISLMLRYLGRSKSRFHLTVLAVLVLAAVALNAIGPSRATAQLLHLLCDPAKTLAFGEVYRFCESPDVIGPFVHRGPSIPLGLNLRLLLNLPLAAAAACLGYAAFSLAADPRGGVDWAVREKVIALIMGFGAAMLVSSTLLDREYARWAFSGIASNDATRAFIDSQTFYAGATSSALLAMIWLFAMGLLLWRRDSEPGREITDVLSRQSSIFAILSVIAPTVFAVLERLL